VSRVLVQLQPEQRTPNHREALIISEHTRQCSCRAHTNTAKGSQKSVLRLMRPAELATVSNTTCEVSTVAFMTVSRALNE
jgi:hypothetical protein